jgi:hypothetical protein
MAEPSDKTVVGIKNKDFIRNAIEKPDNTAILHVDDCSRSNIYSLLETIETGVSKRRSLAGGPGIHLEEQTEEMKGAARKVYEGLFKLACDSFYSPKKIRDVRYVPRDPSTRGWSILEGVFETHLGEYCGLFMFPHNDAKSILFTARSTKKESV